jgi:hypothetical protein
MTKTLHERLVGGCPQGDGHGAVVRRMDIPSDPDITMSEFDEFVAKAIPYCAMCDKEMTVVQDQDWVFAIIHADASKPTQSSLICQECIDYAVGIADEVELETPALPLCKEYVERWRAKFFPPPPKMTQEEAEEHFMANCKCNVCAQLPALLRNLRELIDEELAEKAKQQQESAGA